MAIKKGCDQSIDFVDKNLTPVDWKAIGRRIRRLRGKTINQAQLAKCLGVSQGHISDVEQGYAEMGVIPMLGIAQLFETTVEWLVVGDPESSSESALQEASELLSKNFVRAAGRIVRSVLAAAVSNSAARGSLDLLSGELDEGALSERCRAYGLPKIDDIVSILNACTHNASSPPTRKQVQRVIEWVREFVAESDGVTKVQAASRPRPKGFATERSLERNKGSRTESTSRP